MIFAPLAYYAQSSRLSQWVLGLASLGVLAAFAGRFVFRGTSEPVPLVNPAAQDRYASGELARVAASVGRAVRGLRYSQVVVTSRARAAFLDQARLDRGWDPATMLALQRDHNALRRLFGDELADFLHLRAGDLDDRFAWVRRVQGRGGFAKEFGDILERMEAWR
jgi:2-hydroxychromene-2-carboxylate isomerase